MSRTAPEFTGILRRNIVRMPEAIRSATGIIVLGKRIKSLLFTTDVALIRNHNADAVIAVYPFTPQPIINHFPEPGPPIAASSVHRLGATHRRRRCIDSSPGTPSSTGPWVRPPPPHPDGEHAPASRPAGGPR